MRQRKHLVLLLVIVVTAIITRNHPDNNEKGFRSNRQCSISMIHVYCLMISVRRVDPPIAMNGWIVWAWAFTMIGDYLRVITGWKPISPVSIFPSISHNRDHRLDLIGTFKGEIVLSMKPFIQLNQDWVTTTRLTYTSVVRLSATKPDRPRPTKEWIWWSTRGRFTPTRIKDGIHSLAFPT